MKYPLATVEWLIQLYGSDICLGYDIMCAFIKTLSQSVLRPKIVAFHLHGVVPSFHGHVHNRGWQLQWHPMYTKGVSVIVLFPISLRFDHYFFYWCAVCIIVCYCLLIRIHNPESKYSTPQLLTSDSSCLISCYSCTQPCSSVLQRYINIPRNMHCFA